MRLTFAAIAYFLVNTFAVTAIISLTESKSLLRIWTSMLSVGVSLLL